MHFAAQVRDVSASRDILEGQAQFQFVADVKGLEWEHFYELGMLFVFVKVYVFVIWN